MCAYSCLAAVRQLYLDSCVIPEDDSMNRRWKEELW